MESDHVKILGVWELISMESNGVVYGKDRNELIGSRYEFTAKWLFSMEYGTVRKSRYQLEPERVPSRIDQWASPNFPRTSDIYYLRDDTLIIRSGTNTERPPDFTTSLKDTWTFTYRRVGPPTADAQRHYKRLIHEQLQRGA